MEGGDEGVACVGRYIHPSLIVKVSSIIRPILYGRPWEQGGVVV